MCLENLNFQMTWDKKDKRFVGYGYKKLCCVDANGRLSAPRLKKYMNAIQLENGWFEAIGSKKGSLVDNNHLVMCDDTPQEYFPGFHIFRDAEDAVSYPHIYGAGTGIIKVKFSELIATGTNYAGYRDSVKRFGVCYVAKYMKIVGICQLDSKGKLCV